MISVIGVTDYMSIDGYEKLLYEKNRNGRLNSVDLLIPNIEFRIMPRTSDGKALNIHILVDPSDCDHIDKIKRALRNLKFTYDGQPYGCCRDELIAFAKVQSSSLAGDDDAYKSGISQFKPDRTVIKQWLESEKWLRSNSLIGIANGKDGISGLPLDGFAATRDEILKWSHFIFSGNPQDRKHYLGLKSGTSKEAIIEQYRSLKPCIHGSDAHSIANLFKPNDNRFCWVKSDPTFNGLRQILWEPEDRVHIGTMPPQPSDHSQQIKSISFGGSTGWFANESIPLNSGLVAVIGEKGAGKTAVADLSSFASGYPMEKKSLSSFISKGAMYLSGTKIELTWGAGERTTGSLTDSPHVSSKPRVRYLSQDFVERLCSSDHGGNELQNAIEDVVFAKLDEIQKEGYSSFGELREARESASNVRKEALRGELATLHKEIDRLENSIDLRGAKILSKYETEKQLDELQKQIPEAIQSVDQEVLKRLAQNQSLLKDIEGEIASRSRRRRTIEGALKSYNSIKNNTDSEIARIMSTLLEAGVAETTVLKLAAIWDESVESIIATEAEEIGNEILALKGDEGGCLSPPSICSVHSEIIQLQEQVTKDEVSRQRLLDLQKQIAERTATVQRLEKEIRNLDENVAKILVEQKERQVELYLEVFKALSADEAGLKELYSPLQRAIDQLGEEMQFSVSVGYQINSKTWLDRSSRFFDGRRVNADTKRVEVERIVESQLVPAWKSGDLERIKKAFQELLLEVDVPTFLEKFGTSKLSRVELYDWLFSVDHIDLSYKIQYAGTELEYLSPGTRGIALLVLYLLMDEDDTRPLIIDQPEGNLDNSSVFKQLVPYIRKAKKRRQIILITHNPNLVVATDAEQIIIATADRIDCQPYPRLRYDSGGLEHSASGVNLGVREAVCLLLEGGADAFKARENRYSLTQL
jgi:uncharacterized protein YlxW (UPF0749 family)